MRCPAVRAGIAAIVSTPQPRAHSPVSISPVFLHSDTVSRALDRKVHVNLYLRNKYKSVKQNYFNEKGE